MASAAEKAEYDEIIAPIKNKNEQLKAKIATNKKAKMASNPSDGFAQAKLNLEQIQLLLEETANYILISRVALHRLDLRNESILNQARKNLYLIIQCIEEMVGREIDAPPNSNEEQLTHINEIITNLERFEIIKQIGILTMSVETIYGENTKWKWSFVELEGRLIAAFKNFINFSDLLKNLDPSIEGYSDRMDLITVLNNQIESVGERYRNKYELTGKRIDDMKNAMAFVAFQKRLAILQGDNERAENCKKKYDSWKKKLNDDLEFAEKKDKA